MDLQLNGASATDHGVTNSTFRKAASKKKKRKKRRAKGSGLGQLAGMTDEEKSTWLFKHCQVIPYVIADWHEK